MCYIKYARKKKVVYVVSPKTVCTNKINLKHVKHVLTDIYQDAKVAHILIVRKQEI